MNNIPQIKEADIRSLASAQSWSRGEDYYLSRRVGNVTWRDGVLIAEVEGSEYEPYIVQVQFDGEQISYTDCTCPYDWGGDCKHIIATLLHLCREGNEIKQSPGVADLITNLNRDQLAEIILDLAKSRPDIIDDIERRLPIATSTKQSLSSIELPPINTNLLRRQIKAELRTSIKSGYDSWGEEAFYDSDLGSALEPALEQARSYLDRGETGTALTILETATEAWDDGAGELDDYVYEYFIDVANDFTIELGQMWAEAILMANFSLEELKTWCEKLDDLADTIFGGESLEIAVTAAEQGWTYPPLVAAMGGNITDKGVWEDEVPYYADDLARIRLEILAQREQFQEYLNLAQVEGQFMLYLHMLVKQKQSDKAMEEAMEYLTIPENFHELARTLTENDEIEKAFQLAQHGLDQEDERGKAALAEWLRDQAVTNRRPDLAFRIAKRALAERVALDNYQKLQEISGETWENLRDEALTTTSQGKSASDQIDIYLHEKMHKEAIEVVDQTTWFYNIDKVIEAVKVDFPEWAFHQCWKRATEIMDAGRAKDYRVAADWLRRGRDILVPAGMSDMWKIYLDQAMEKHQRKYKLMPMLRKLQT